MNLEILTKTFLSVYRYLKPLTKSIDKVVKLKCINSSNFSYYYANNTQDLTEEILELTSKKVSFINIKIIVDKILLKLDQNQARVLILKYIDGLKSKQICELMGYIPRTYFRKVNSALNIFQKHLENYLNNNPSVFSQLKRDAWVNMIVKGCEQSKTTFELVESGIFYKNMIKALNSSVMV